MINSMTGFGDAESRCGDITYAVEIKTLNGRYFKTSIKLPEAIAFLEDDVETLLRQNLSRGMVNCNLRIKDFSTKGLFNIDEKALQTLIRQLKEAASSAGVECSIDIAGLLDVPGVLIPAEPDEKKAQQIKEAVLDLTAKALEKLQQMRATEGAALAADLQQNCQAVKQNLEKVRQRTGVVLENYQNKLEKRVNDLLAKAKLKLDEDTLTREVAVFADRSDISEELARLDSHLGQFDHACQSDGQTGRKLDFISQEMLREVNTIASKAADVEIARYAVEMKCMIDRIKEQVQNVE